MATKRTYTITEAAELVGLSRKALARRIERGSIRSVVRNGRRLVPRSELVRVGLLRESGDEGAADVAAMGLAPPQPAPQAEADTALVALVRDLMERVERQANELAQFRALTVQAESLRADRELTELRARLAALENQSGQGRDVSTLADPNRSFPPAHAPRRDAPSTSIWVPPGAVQAPRDDDAPRTSAPRPRVDPTLPPRGINTRFVALAIEALFVVAAAVVAGLAGLRPAAIVAVTLVAWALVAAVEAVAWYQRQP